MQQVVNRRSFVMVAAVCAFLAYSPQNTAAEQIPTVNVTDTGPDRDIPIARSFYISGQAKKNVTEIRPIIVRKGGTSFLSSNGGSCQNLVANKAYKEGVFNLTAGTNHATSIWQSGSGKREVLLAPTWTATKENKGKFKILVPADQSFYASGTSFCLVLLQSSAILESGALAKLVEDEYEKCATTPGLCVDGKRGLADAVDKIVTSTKFEEFVVQRLGNQPSKRAALQKALTKQIGETMGSHQLLDSARKNVRSFTFDWQATFSGKPGSQGAFMRSAQWPSEWEIDSPIGQALALLLARQAKLFRNVRFPTAAEQVSKLLTHDQPVELALFITQQPSAYSAFKKEADAKGIVAVTITPNSSKNLATAVVKAIKAAKKNKKTKQKIPTLYLSCALATDAVWKKRVASVAATNKVDLHICSDRVVNYMYEDGLEIQKIGLLDDLSSIRLSGSLDGKIQIRVLKKVDLETLTFSGSTVSVREFFQFLRGYLRDGTKYRSAAYIQRTLVKQSAEKDEFSTSQLALLASLEPRIRALGTLFRESLISSKIKSRNPSIDTRSSLTGFLGEWLMAEKLLVKCDSTKKWLGCGKQAPPDTNVWPGYASNGDNPLSIFANAIKEVKTHGTELATHRKKLRTLQIKLSSMSPIPVNVGFTQEKWVFSYVTPVVGYALMNSDGSKFNTPYLAAQLHLFPNNVDSPQWGNGWGDLNRVFSVEFGIGTSTSDLGPGGRVRGWSGLPPLFLGGALQIIPYTSVSAGVSFVEQRRSNLASEKYKLSPRLYFGLSVQINIPDLIRGSATSTTSVTASKD